MKLKFITIALIFFCLSEVQAQSFVTIWKTDNIGVSDSNQITFNAQGDFNYTWKEVGNPSNTGSGSSSGGILRTLTFSNAGTYELSITPTGTTPFNRFFFTDGSTDQNKIIKVTQWGNIAWSSMENAFLNAVNLDITATDIPNLSGVTNLSRMFYYNSNLIANASFSSWNVGNVTNMEAMFGGAKLFNQPLNAWNVSKVISMNYMFFNAFIFNQPLNNWNVSAVVDMALMFNSAEKFNQPLNNWNVGNVVNMTAMFSDAKQFNQPLNSWNLKSVTSMNSMFRNSGLSCENYGKTIRGWAANSNTKTGVNFGNQNGMTYGALAYTDRLFLINNKAWTIYGDDYNPACECTTIPKAINKTLCEGKKYTDDGQNYTQTGTYTYTKKSSNPSACDTVITLNLTIAPFLAPISATNDGYNNKYCYGESIKLTSSGGTNATDIVNVWYAAEGETVPSSNSCNEGIIELFNKYEYDNDNPNNCIYVNNNEHTVSVNSGIAHFEVKTGDPFIWMYPLENNQTIDAANYGYVNVRYKIVNYTQSGGYSGPPQLSIFFTKRNLPCLTTGSGSYLNSGQYPFVTSLWSNYYNTINDGNWHIVSVKMKGIQNWNGIITGLRIDYFDPSIYSGNNGSKMDIDFITVSKYPMVGEGSVLTLNVPPTPNTYNNYYPSEGSTTTFYAKKIGNCGVTSCATTTVTVLPKGLRTTNVSICNGESYTVDGHSYTTVGNHTYTKPSTIAGICDSTISINLSIKSNQTKTVTASICQGQSYTIDGNTYTYPATYAYTKKSTNPSACDTIITVNLTVKPIQTKTINASICQGQSYTIDGHTYTQTGTYTYTKSSTNPSVCDTTITVNLTINSTQTKTVNPSICAGQSYIIDGQTYTQAGTYTYTKKSTNPSACDTVITVNLTIKSNQTKVINASVCQGQSYAIDGHTYTTAGTHTYTQASANPSACDTTVTVNLSFKPIQTKVVSASVCAGQSYTIDGNTYSATGTYSYTKASTNSSSCDTLITVRLIVKSILTKNITQVICEGETYSFNGHTYTTSGTYRDTLKNEASNGCDSIVITNLKVNKIALKLTVSPALASYGEQVKLDIQTSSVIQTAEWSPESNLSDKYSHNPILTVMEPSWYVVKIFDDNGCEAMDSIFVGIDNDKGCFFLPNTFTPNGNSRNDIFRPLGKFYKELIILRIFDRWGKVIFETNDTNIGWDGTFQGQEMPPGVYFYYLEGTCIDGKNQFIKGDVSLIR